MMHQRSEKTLRDAAILLLLTVAALLLRLHGLGRESLWWDEYASHVFLNAPTLREFLDLNRTLDPLSLPVYFSLEYLWARHVSDAVFSLRLLSIAFGVLVLPVVYALGKRIYGPWAAIVAALLLTLSPVHIHHAQSIRMYALFVLLAAVMAWSFVCLIDRRRWPWWALHLGTSLLLYWTHPMAALVSAALGAWLLITWRKNGALLFRWTAAQALLFAPTLLYLSRLRFWPQDTTGQWMERPSLATLAADLFFDDISVFHWQFRLSPLAEAFGGLRLLMDVFFALLIAILLVCLAAKMWRRRSPQGDAIRVRSMTLMLVLWMVLPPVILFVASWGWRPCMFPRYTVHCSLAQYLLLGGAVHHIQDRRRRIVIILLLATMMGLQWLWLQPGPQRTDWRAAANLIHEQAGPEDLVLVENTLWRDVFVHNAAYLSHGPLPIPVAAARGEAPLAGQTLLYLGMNPQYASSAPGETVRVWVVYAGNYFDPTPLYGFETIMIDAGVAYERLFFPAIRNIHVYVVHASRTATLPDRFSEVLTRIRRDAPTEMDHHAMQAFGDLATELAEHGRGDMAAAIGEELIAVDSFANQIYGSFARALGRGESGLSEAAAVRALWEGYGHRDNRHGRHAAKAFERAAAGDPNNALAHLELGMELAAAGAYGRAGAALERASELDDDYRAMTDNLRRALQSGEAPETAFKAVRLYRDSILALSMHDLAAVGCLLRQALAYDPKLQPAQETLGYLGYLLMNDGQLEEAYAVLRDYLDVTDRPAAHVYGNLALLYTVRGEREQARRHARKALALDDAFKERFELFCQLMFEDWDYAAAAAELDRLRAEDVYFPPFFIRYLQERAEARP